jgi:hypothetical protein
MPLSRSREWATGAISVERPLDSASNAAIESELTTAEP